MKDHHSEKPLNGEKMNVAKFGFMGALAAMVCCLGPLVPILLGLGGATALFGLDRYKPWFIAAGLVILALASWYAVRKQNQCCAVRSTARNVKTVATIFGVGIGAYLLLQFAIVPALASVASAKVAAAHDSANPASGGQEVRLHVEGMTCAACAIGVETAFRELPGVSSAKVDWQTGKATVHIDPDAGGPEDLLKAKVESHYRLKLTDPKN